jgi:hypothetical protein
MCRVNDTVALIDVPIPVKIVGDIHGQFFDLQRIFLSIGLPGSHRFLFLGGKSILRLLAYKAINYTSVQIMWTEALIQSSVLHCCWR